MSVTSLQPPSLAVRSPLPRSASGISKGAIVLICCAALAYAPRLLEEALRLWSQPEHQFFPFVLLGSAVLARQRLRDAGPRTPGSPLVSNLIFGFSILLLLGAILIDAAWVGCVSALVALLGGIHAWGGKEMVRRLAPAWLFLWLALPPPLEADKRLIVYLQDWTTRASSFVLDSDELHVIHAREGNLIVLPTKRLFVDESCSGIQSFYSAMAVTIFLILYLRKSLIFGLLLVAAAFAWVMAANILRITVIAVAMDRRQIDLTAGWHHEMLGWGTFVIALLGIASTGRFLSLVGRLFKRAPQPEHAPILVLPARAPLPLPRPAFQGMVPVATVFGLLGLLQLGWWMPASMAESNLPVLSSRSIPDLGDKLLPESFGVLNRDKHYLVDRPASNYLGVHSQVWHYLGNQRGAQVSLDYPFDGWHDMLICYRGQGWTVLDREVRGSEETGGQYVAVHMQRKDKLQGYLCFSDLTRHGRAVLPMGTPAERYVVRLNRLLPWQARLDEQESFEGAFQMQFLLESYEPLKPAEEQAGEKFFIEARKRIGKSLNELVEGSP